MADTNETAADIIAWLRRPREGENGYLTAWRDEIADRLEAAYRRERGDIHRAMVILAGIEMPNPDYPPRLWTALEDAYDALSDALGTDGCTTSDEEEAKATGRHFVIQPRGDCAKLREALKKCLLYITCVESVGIGTITLTLNDKVKLDPKKIIKSAQAALAKPWRNCDVGTEQEQIERFNEFCNSEWRDNGNANCGNCPLWVSGTIGHDCQIRWAQMPYEEGGEK